MKNKTRKKWNAFMRKKWRKQNIKRRKRKRKETEVRENYLGKGHKQKKLMQSFQQRKIVGTKKKRDEKCFFVFDGGGRNGELKNIGKRKEETQTI